MNTWHTNPTTLIQLAASVITPKLSGYSHCVLGQGRQQLGPSADEQNLPSTTGGDSLAIVFQTSRLRSAQRAQLQENHVHPPPSKNKLSCRKGARHAPWLKAFVMFALMVVSLVAVFSGRGICTKDPHLPPMRYPGRKYPYMYIQYMTKSSRAGTVVR